MAAWRLVKGVARWDFPSDGMRRRRERKKQKPSAKTILGQRRRRLKDYMEGKTLAMPDWRNSPRRKTGLTRSRAQLERRERERRRGELNLRRPFRKVK
jgi:hypothetical protein